MALTACGDGVSYRAMPQIVSVMEIDDIAADRLNPVQYREVVNRFVAAETIYAVLWPSNYVDRAESAALLERGRKINALPSEFAETFGPSPIVLNSVLEVYRRNIKRGYNEALQRTYFQSKWGEIEVRAVYVAALVDLCSSATKADEDRALDMLAGLTVDRFVCKANAAFNEAPLP